MKFNKWTVALASIGVVSLASAARADEQPMQMNAVNTALSSTTISGYVDTAAAWRPGTDQGNGYGGPNIPAYSFAKNDGFSLNAVDIALDKPMDASPWAAGYHVELMMGPDAAALGTTLAIGNTIENNNGGYQNWSATAIRQAYLTLRTPIGNGIDWKFGVFDTIIGYESTSDPLDPNYTRSYGYSIEPTTHTGILATYKVNDMFTVSAGIANTYGPVVGGTSDLLNNNPLGSSATFESQKTYLGSITFTAPDSAGWMNGATVTLGVVNAIDSSAGAGSRTSWYAGMTMPTPVTALKLGATLDYLDLHNSSAANPSDDSTWVLGLYSSYQATDKLNLNLRGEYLSSNGNGLYNSAAYPGNAAEEFTATAQYQLWANVISRLEFRWDHVEHGNFFGSNSAGNAYRANDFLLALNMIYQF